jgi:hypothetical protein
MRVGFSIREQGKPSRLSFTPLMELRYSELPQSGDRIEIPGEEGEWVVVYRYIRYDEKEPVAAIISLTE